MHPILKRCLYACLAIMLTFSLSGCKKETVSAENSDTISVYSTFYPIFAITEMITDNVDGVNTACLVQPQDGCLRNYELSDWDVELLIRSADAVIAGGRGMESFESALYMLGENGPAVSSLMFNMALDRAEAVGKPSEEASHWDDDNPHIYMSIDGAEMLAASISASMQELDPKYAEKYSTNLEKTEEKLAGLKAQMHSVSGDLGGRKVAILNEAIWYFAKEFDLDAALCYHRESGDGINNIEELTALLKNSGAEVILIEKQAPYALVEVLEGAGFAVAKIDILSTHSAKEGSEGYFAAQISNAEVLKAAFDASAAINSEE